MATITQGHTPPIRIHEKNGVDFSQFDHVYVTLRQGLLTLTKKDEQLTIDGDTITFRLSQAESLGFLQGKEFELQVNVTYNGGLRNGNSIPVTVAINKNLLFKVVE